MTTDDTSRMAGPALTQESENQAPQCLFKRSLLFLLFLLVGIGGTMAVHALYPETFPRLAGAHVDTIERQKLVSRLEALEGAVSRLELEIKALEKTEPEGSAKADPALRGDIDLLEQTVEKLQDSFDSASTSFQTIQKQVQDRAGIAMGYMLMRDKALDGKAFGQERLWLLERVKQDEKARDSLERLKPYDSGLTPVGVLYGEWKTLEPDVKAAMSEEKATNWQERLLASASSLIRIESLKDSPLGEGAAGAIRHALEKDEINKAMELALSLKGPAREAVQPWIERVETRLEAEKLIQDLATIILTAPPVADTEQKVSP